MDAASGSLLYSITVDSVSLEAACPGPENGMFIAVELHVDAVSEVTIDATDFVVTGSDGTTTYPGTAAAAACVPATPLLPTSLPAGSYAGTVVLDVAASTGAIIHRPDPMAAGASWGF